ncbi:8-amino-7-oxononanoate synthase [Myroides marinus]|uniref:8-amino-7-oxononanoate synthase n=1 Tax=Myroides marinus TaxID=703342 RepID=A0A1H6Y437_9FLAO|nr:pyridoxal phosphate-dependent aminotransferase family protein [Myroides marinus]MDM1383181.1 pyridoxal phosphate-dependent aminotransferase family protein [Myroides marinus]SEJ35206.1 8-amino-7-oxononanoate synthase [Myroides marinus]
MIKLPESLQYRLNKRIIQGNYRTLKHYSSCAVDFISNDYLGFSRDLVFQKELLHTVVANPKLLTGSTGSRLISGNSELIEDIETNIASLHKVEAALLFGSGYQANLALFGNLPTSKDTVIVDELIHRSVHDGCLLSKARKWKFKHNNLQDLERLLKKASGEVYIAIESLYSMDGDLAPLEQICVLARRYGAFLIVDEAHAIGVYGLGRVYSLALQDQVFATLVTYGKAMGVHGAAVLASHKVINSLINYATSFIYSTAITELMAVSIDKAYQHLFNYPDVIDKLQFVISTYHSLAPVWIRTTPGPIQTIFLSNIKDKVCLVSELETANINTCIIVWPTVAVGTERIRICLHAFNTQKDIISLFNIINKHYESN